MGLFTVWEIIMGNAITALGGVMFMVAFVLATVGAWVQHFITTVSEKMALLAENDALAADNVELRRQLVSMRAA